MTTDGTDDGGTVVSANFVLNTAIHALPSGCALSRVHGFTLSLHFTLGIDLHAERVGGSP